MFCLTRPSDARIRRFLERQRGLPYSYPDVGASLGEPPAGYVLDHHRVRLGEGPRAFERRRAALRGWAMFRVGWVEAWPPEAPIEEGTTVALLARGPGLWSLFACRIVRVIEEHGPVESFGFAYGTLPGHAARGEERFMVAVGPRRGLRLVRPARVSRPSCLAWRLGYPAAPPDPAAVRPGIPAGHGPGRRRRRAMSGRSYFMPERVGCRRPLGAPVGGLAWAVGVLALRPGWAEAMLLLASFAVVPLGLGLAVSPTPGAAPGPGGWPSGSSSPRPWPSRHRSPCRPGDGRLLALPWLVATVLVALHGLWRLWRGPRRRPRSAWTRGSSTWRWAGPGR